MCGINGIIDWQATDKKALVTAMCNTMVHRGPDDQGVTQIPGACLGHRRLSIIDLSPTGHQPMSDANGEVWVVFNGEIYGYQQLRDELSPHHPFQSQSDTEVLIYGYKTWGIETLCRRLTGMFAFALYDLRNQTLFLARDRFGEKPLYYKRESNGEVRFSSNTQALFVGGRRPEVNPTGIMGFLHAGHCLPQLPALNDVTSVEPGTFHTLKQTGVDAKRYWASTFANQPQKDNQVWLEDIHAALKKAVANQLVADVPVGCLLSGGVDSSLVASIAAEVQPDLQLFTVRMPGSHLDESEKAAKIAAAIGGKHHIIDAKPITLDQFRAFQSTFSEPLGDASSIAVWMVSKYAREHVKVVLTGDGGDELFAGYLTIDAQIQADRYRPFTANPLGRVGANVLRAVGESFADIPPIRKLLTASELFCGDAASSYIGSGLVPRALRRQLPGPALREAAANQSHLAVLHHLWNRGDASNPLEAMLQFDLSYRLVGDYLPKVDTATMASSQEARSPFLDHKLAELAFSAPFTVKRLNGESKGLIKQLLRDRLGPSASAATGKKQGFVVPINQWLTGEWSKLSQDLTTSPLIKDGLIDAQAVDTVRKRAHAGDDSYDRIHYSLVVLDLWYRNLANW